MSNKNYNQMQASDLNYLDTNQPPSWYRVSLAKAVRVSTFRRVNTLYLKAHNETSVRLTVTKSFNKVNWITGVAKIDNPSRFGFRYSLVD